ncbi:MAG TPA: hypothetical protein VEK33_05960 [Terriglobales bacterium]|nr:hypothetical protein [Terriglobales bacterium]
MYLDINGLGVHYIGKSMAGELATDVIRFSLVVGHGMSMAGGQI